jgi:hypothetical protein
MILKSGLPTFMAVANVPKADGQDRRWRSFASVVFLDTNTPHACELFIHDLYALALLEASCHE